MRANTGKSRVVRGGPTSNFLHTWAHRGTRQHTKFHKGCGLAALGVHPFKDLLIELFYLPIHCCKKYQMKKLLEGLHNVVGKTLHNESTQKHLKANETLLFWQLKLKKLTNTKLEAPVCAKS